MAFTPWDPAPGLYAIGATVLQGPYAPDINTYAWFRTHKALARLGNALWLYQVSPRPAASWAVLCALEPSPETVRAKLNATTGQGTRVLQPDCAQAWIFPPGPGVYVVPAKDTKASLTTIPSPAAPATVAVPPGAQLELQARRADGSAFYVVYRLDSAHLPPAQTMGDVRVNGPLSFLGYTLTTTQIIPGEVIGCHTYWQVRDLSQEGQGEAWAGRPLSLMAHLIGPDGTAVDVRDGLGVPIEQWQPGDIIVQRHTLNVPAGAPSGTYVIHVGAYWLDTMARWTVQDAMGTDDKIVIRVNAP